ncbi:MAG: bifunctional adenosylcobinamide kinase/adenosylcobinamide-phosphate guanylyltransferase [Mariprofundaceae bacterium]|nr:bifunctional adenosylcobinamide kinase/adenosylcobinamide-phosphate guanylyltransferase [Mariprofundaceae bacterium]
MVTSSLILGGSRSGKSHYAEQRAVLSGLPVTYIATAPHIADDAEWNQRIAEHRQRRPATWQTVEEPLNLARVLSDVEHSGRLLLVDCLSLWLSNLLYQQQNIEQAQQELCTMLTNYSSPLLLVSNEVGMGLVPEQAASRAFRDAQGCLNQAVAAAVDEVFFIAAGLPLTLK